MMSISKKILKKIVPDSCVNLVRAMQGRVPVDIARRARKIGLQGKSLRNFLNDPDASAKLEKLIINGGPKKVSFLRESKCFIIESILEDAYQLEKIEWPRDKNIRIVDIGANVGTFAIAARNEFENATIHCYEINPFLKDVLALHTYNAGAKLYMEGVGFVAGTFSLDERPNKSNMSNSVAIVDFTQKGNIPIIPLKEVAKRIGGKIDLLKMDCEGSEWVILQDRETLKQTKYLTLEYHRFSPDGSFDMFDLSIDIQKKAIDTVCDLGFEILHVRKHTRDAGILLARNKSL
ncbi:MAG TPA: FkbM family methyltransferase [Chlamydiales bacterium]|nr:FkbM family methyltransferase [Chlamydiales bacterium]